jgi:hypothetical protein
MRTAMCLLLLAFAVPAHAERCWMTGGCVGQIGYMHVPRSQRETATVFVKSGLPNVNAVTVLKKNGFVFPPSSFSDSRFLGDLAKAVEENRQLAWGMELANGAQIRVLGYQPFAAGKGKEYIEELFLIVLIITDR